MRFPVRDPQPSRLLTSLLLQLRSAVEALFCPFKIGGMAGCTCKLVKHRRGRLSILKECYIENAVVFLMELYLTMFLVHAPSLFEKLGKHTREATKQG